MSFETDIRPEYLQAPVYSAAQRQDYLGYIHKSTKAAAKILFPNVFHRPFDKAHDALFEVVDDDSLRFVVVIGPRGCGKTKITQLAMPARRLLMRMTHYFVPIGENLDNEVVQTENLKAELEYSEQVQKLFGSPKGATWAKTEWETAPLLRKDGSIADRGSFVRPRGAGQEVRSITYHEYRPDFVLMDDIQTREEAQNEKACADLMTWLYSDVLGCVDVGKKDWRIFVIGNNLSERCMVVQLAGLQTWNPVRLKLCDPTTYVSNFPNYVNDAGVKDLVKRYEDADMFDVFCREYMDLNTPSKGAAFTKEYFQKYDENDPEFVKRLPYLFNAVIMDPAKTRTTAAADTAITGIGFDNELRQLYFRDCIADKLTPEQGYDAAIDMCIRLKSRVLAVEVTSLHEFITKPLIDRIRTRGVQIELVELHARKYADQMKGKHAGKIARASALISYYRMKQVWHNKAFAHMIEAPLMAYPNPPRWDVIDTWAYGIELLEMHGVYMMPSEKLQDKEDNPFLSSADLTPEDIEIARMFGSNVFNPRRISADRRRMGLV